MILRGRGPRCASIVTRVTPRLCLFGINSLLPLSVMRHDEAVPCHCCIEPVKPSEYYLCSRITGSTRRQDKPSPRTRDVNTSAVCQFSDVVRVPATSQVRPFIAAGRTGDSRRSDQRVADSRDGDEKRRSDAEIRLRMRTVTCPS